MATIPRSVTDIRVRPGDSLARRTKAVMKLQRTPGADAAEVRRANPQAEYRDLKDYVSDRRRRPSLTAKRHYKENR